MNSPRSPPPPVVSGVLLRCLLQWQLLLQLQLPWRLLGHPLRMQLLLLRLLPNRLLQQLPLLLLLQLLLVRPHWLLLLLLLLL